jgi:hypothetical protein
MVSSGLWKRAVALNCSLFILASVEVFGQTCPVPGFTTQSARPHNVVVPHSWYDYEPTIMKDGKYRMWWCGSTGVGGDVILYSEADNMDGPWSSPVSTFQPTGNSADFDSVHVCDPSVIRVAGTYYMYYGGWNNISYPDPGARTAETGVATSVDGRNWTRLNGGQPIIRPARGVTDPAFPSLPVKYGAGQPSVTYLNGLFYLVYTDTTGVGGNAYGGLGVYVLRSSDPTFQNNVEELVGPGTFATRTPSNHTTYPFMLAWAVDWQYVDMTDEFAIAESGVDTSGNQMIRVHLFTQTLSGKTGEVDIPGGWQDGPGIVSRPDKHAVPSTQCGVVPFDVFKATGPANDPYQWDIAHAGVDWNTGLPCTCSQLPKVFEGEGIRAPGSAWSVVVGGTRAQFQLSAPIFQVTKNMWDLSNAMYNLIPYGASVFAGNYAIISSNQPGGVVLDDGRNWLVSCMGFLNANGSTLTSVTPSQYSSYPIGNIFWCMQ